MSINQMIEDWKNILLKPNEAYKEMVKRANFKDGFYHLLVLIVYSILYYTSLFFLLGQVIVGSVISESMFLTSMFFLIIIIFFIALIVFLLYNGFLFVIARLLGGKGSLGQQFHLITATAVPISVISTLLGLIPCIGFLFGILIFLYSVYLSVLALREVHGYSTLKAFITYIAMIVLFGLLFYVIILVITSTISRAAFLSY